MEDLTDCDDIPSKHVLGRYNQLVVRPYKSFPDSSMTFTCDLYNFLKKIFDPSRDFWIDVFSILEQNLVTYTHSVIVMYFHRCGVDSRCGKIPHMHMGYVWKSQIWIDVRVGLW